MSCSHCGKCCGYVALEVSADTARWIRMHNIPVAEEDGVCKVTIAAPCKYRDAEAQRCTRYEDRPEICRTYLCEQARGS